jgi:hypothetical protein
MKLDEIKKALQKWKDVRTSPDKAASFLKQGTCFKIKKEQYEKWKEHSPTGLFAYVGIFDHDTKFVLVDNVSNKDFDANKDFIFVQDYLSGISLEEGTFIDRATDGNITVLDALKKALRWTLCLDDWAHYKVKTTYGIFEAQVIPFSDLAKQFEGAVNPESIAIFGIRSDKEADLSIWMLGVTSSGSATTETTLLAAAAANSAGPVQDLSYPCPPYSVVETE